MAWEKPESWEGNGDDDSGGGGEEASDALSFSDLTVLAGTITDGGDGVLNLSIPMGAPLWISGGLDDALGGAYWVVDVDDLDASINLVLEWVSTVNQTMVTLGVHKAASPPTSLADLNTANSHFLQTTQSGAGGVSTYLKNASNNFSSGPSENKSGSVQVNYTVGCSIAGYGGALCHHVHDNGTDYTGKEHATDYTATGNAYIVLTWTPWNALSLGNTIQLKVRKT